ncbi:ATP-binding protein [Kribbella sp. NPDC051936]|uniref:ATP-binding protein n=1 Tax=Kribbella sp. NPDC051936 TaxID=3154946 RepID=UPI003438B24C
MTLIDRIVRALDAGVDHDVLERAAIALLRAQYPSLSAVEAGKDIGRDGDIYGVVADDPEGRGRVLATTGDPLANLKRSHKSWQKYPGFRVDKIVVVCSNDITASTRLKMDQYCQKHSLPIPEYFGRDWLVAALVRDSEWRLLLTGVAGRMDSLVGVPAPNDGQVIPFVGREQVLRELKAALSEGQDVVLAGVPGVGKSRLLSELADAADILFAVPEAKHYLADDLLMLAPSCVVVDDAHLSASLLAELTRLRQQERLPFAVVATTWPEQVDAVTDVLSSGRTLTLDLMARAELDAIVQALGVTGVRARHTILDQADGRPGWAVLLCRAVVDGNGQQVESGAVLLQKVMRFMRGATDSAVTLDAIACIAALTAVSQDDLARVAQLVDRPLAELNEGVRTVATRGLLELRSDRWEVSPTIRYPLVSHWFFGPLRNRPWSSLVAAFPEADSTLTETLMHAAALSPDAQREARSRMANLGAPESWTEATLHVVQLYAVTAREAGDFAAKSARVILSSERAPVVSPWGTPHDPLGAAAEETLLSCARTWFNEEAVHGLLDLALRDSRPLSSRSSLDELSKLTRYLDPDLGSLFEVRERLLGYATRWLQVDPQPRWPVFGAIVGTCFDPSVEGTWSEPDGSGKFTIASGVESAARLGQMIELWDGVATLIAGEDPAELPAETLSSLIGLFEDWLRLASGHINGTATPTEAQIAAGYEGSWMILRAIRPLLDSRSGSALRVQRELDLAERWGVRPPADIPPIDLDGDLVQFVGRRDPFAPIEEWRHTRDAEQRALAARLNQLGPDAGAARFQELVDAAAEVDHREPAELVARRVIDEATEPTAWIVPAIAHRSRALLTNALWAARRLGRRIDVVPVARALQDDALRGGVIAAVVGVGDRDQLADIVVSALTADDAWQLESLQFATEPNAVLGALLDHPVIQIRAAAALAFDVGIGHGVPLPEDLRLRWESAFLDADDGTAPGQHGRWRLKEILEALAVSQPSLSADWFEHRLLNGDKIVRASSRWIDDVEAIPRTLPAGERERLARLAAGAGYPGYQLLPPLLEADPELAARLLREGVLDGHRALDMLTGELDHGVEVLGPVLLAHGVPALQIAQQISRSRTWTGLESDALKSDITKLEEMAERVPALADVTAYAISAARRELDRTLEAEREQARRGMIWD